MRNALRIAAGEYGRPPPAGLSFARWGSGGGTPRRQQAFVTPRAGAMLMEQMLVGWRPRPSRAWRVHMPPIRTLGAHCAVPAGQTLHGAGSRARTARDPPRFARRCAARLPAGPGFGRRTKECRRKLGHPHLPMPAAAPAAWAATPTGAPARSPAPPPAVPPTRLPTAHDEVPALSAVRRMQYNLHMTGPRRGLVGGGWHAGAAAGQAPVCRPDRVVAVALV